MQIVGPVGSFTGIECDIAPIANCDTFVHYTSQVSGWPGGGYNSAFAWWNERVSIFEFSGASCFMIWDRQPTLLNVSGSSQLGYVQYDSESGYYAALVGISSGYNYISSQPATSLQTFRLHGTGSGYSVDYTEYFNYIGEPVIVYVWSSVPAVSGKNGILSLPTLIDTDGEPISGQSASVFSSLPEGSNVRALINGAL